jgi:hypothetical protein
MKLAEVVRVDPKSVERWIRDGRVPRIDNQWTVAAVLRADRSYLWPDDDAEQPRSSVAGEVVAQYAHRGRVPARLWTYWILGPTTSVSILVYAGLPWFEANPEVLQILRRRADDGVTVRLAMGDPDCPAVVQRGIEEGVDMSARIRNALRLVEPLVGHPGIEIRLHATTLYDSIYLADDEVLVNHHSLSTPASQSPVTHLRRIPGGLRYDQYARSFTIAWRDAHPYP